MNDVTYTFILSQIRNQKRLPKARRYSLDEKILALSIYKSSGRGYRLLSKLFALPSVKTLTNLLNKISLTPGINEHVFSSLKKNCCQNEERRG